jgi:hypothetical protein
VILHGTPLWVIVSVCPDTVIMPVLIVLLVFGATV